ncbi:uncharacterized protein LOC144350655 [Saccoglossus kowalevskii]
MTPTERLEAWKKATLEEDGKQPNIYYDIDSKYPFRQIVGFYKKQINLRIHPLVHFVCDEEQEVAIDAEGPSRNYFKKC